MSNLKEIQQIKSLIVKGKQKGFLTFDEVNKALPSEVNNPEQLEEVIAIFDQLDINLVDTDKDGRKIEVAGTETEETPDADLELTENEDTLDYASRSTDPVRMYLREMGACRCLIARARSSSPRRSKTAKWTCSTP